MKRIIAILVSLLFFATGLAAITGCGLALTAANAGIIGSSVLQMQKSDKNDNDSRPKHWNPGTKRWEH